MESANKNSFLPHSKKNRKSFFCINWALSIQYSGKVQLNKFFFSGPTSDALLFRLRCQIEIRFFLFRNKGLKTVACYCKKREILYIHTHRKYVDEKPQSICRLDNTNTWKKTFALQSIKGHSTSLEKKKLGNRYRSPLSDIQ